MQPKIRRKSHSLIDSLKARPQDYEFVQTVRIIERLDSSKKNSHQWGRGFIGKFNSPAQESIRFTSKPTLAYVESDVQQRPYVISDKGNYKIQFNGLGLLGSSGVLPYHYTELLLQRQKQKDDALLHFIDMLNHRFSSLLYRVSTKYSIPVNLEQSTDENAADNFSTGATQALLSLIGLGTSRLQNRLNVHDHSLIYYSGLFVSRIRNAEGLKNLLSDYFDLNVRIEEFIGQWQDLIGDVKTRMSDKEHPKGQNAQLGLSAMLGARAWIAQSKIRIVIGPLDKEKINLFAPGTTTFETMNQLVQFYLGVEQDYEFIMEVSRKDLPSKLLLNKHNSPIMGWNAWMGRSDVKDSTGDNEIVRIKISARRN